MDLVPSWCGTVMLGTVIQNQKYCHLIPSHLRHNESCHGIPNKPVSMFMLGFIRYQVLKKVLATSI